MNRAMMKLGCRKPLFSNVKGQSLVEFALILPVLALMIAGIFDLGRAFYSSITITNAAREGARYGTLFANDAQGICDLTKEEAVDSGITIISSNISIDCTETVTCLDSSTPSAVCTRNNPITVSITYTYDVMLLGFFFPSGIVMNRSAEMLVP